MRVAIITLGCDKNSVDNEYLAGMLSEAGCEVVTEAAGPGLDAAVVTTCGFIAAAKQQSVDTIRQLAALKRETASPRRLFVAGCFAQLHGESLMAEFPEIDGLVGVGQFKEMTAMILRDETESNGSPPPRPMQVAPVPTVDIYTHLRRKPLDDAPHAFLKISDGCNHTCSFCAIPSMKGRLRSVDPEILLEEARRLLDRGVKEINLVAQDLSDYGRDRGKSYRLPELLRDICALPGDFWVRCLYYYPGNVTERFLEVMATEDKIVPYLEMPLQHLDPGVLRAMKRPFHEVNTFKLIERIRAAVPGIVLRTTFIVGFPGETQKAFQSLLNGMQKLGFDRMGAFEYSPEEGTPAQRMSRPVSASTKTQRWRMVMARQAKISARLARRRVGRTERVLLERFDEQSGHWIARSTADAPEVDAKVFIPSRQGLQAGEFTQVRIAKAMTYDVVGHLCAPVSP